MAMVPLQAKSPPPSLEADPPSRRWSLLPRVRVREGKTFTTRNLQKLLRKTRQARRRLKWREKIRQRSEGRRELPGDLGRRLREQKVPDNLIVEMGLQPPSISLEDSLLSELSTSRGVERRTRFHLQRISIPRGRGSRPRWSK